MERIARIVAFTGNPALETAISERLGFTADYIENNGLMLPDGTRPHEDWPCAIFVPEAGMYGFDLRCQFDGMLCGKDACADYGLPKDVETAVHMCLVGGRTAIEGFCQAVCDRSGLTCHLMSDMGDRYELAKTLSPSGAFPAPKDFLGLLFEPVDD